MGCLFSSEKKVEKSRLIIHAHNGSNESPVRPLSPPPSSHSPPRTPPASRATIPPSRTSSNQLRPTLSSAVPGAALPSIETLTTDIGTKWAKPINTFPIATDFPRLAKLTSIYVGAEQRDVTHQILDANNNDGDGDVHLRHYGDDQTIEETLYAALITLAIHLHDSTALANTKQHFWEFHKGDIEGEVARNFGSFLKSYMQEDGNNVACVLKAINQAILAPAIIALKMAISTLPFKDFRNSWRVKILISNDDFVDVVHVRREQSFISQQPEEMRFEFVWELRIRIALGSAGAAGSSSSTTLQTINNNDTNGHTNTNNNNGTTTTSITDKRVQNVTLQIVEIAFGPGVPAHNREKILGDMNKITASNCVISTMPA